jgi:ABC-type transport system involved in multi-copper enzyme maturation permease subunit
MVCRHERPADSARVEGIPRAAPGVGGGGITIGADTGLRGTGMHSLFPLGMFAYIAGSLALGAHVIGHEFTNRTLASLLVQPCRRSSILLTKASVLAVMLVALGFIARAVLFQSLARTFGNFPRYPTLGLPLIGGFCVAPYLTMRLRSQMAGVVFTASIPGMTYLLALLGGVVIYGTGTAAAEALALDVWMPAMWIFAAAGAVLSARSFMRLQDTEGGGEELRLPRWFTVTDASPTRPPLWMLAKKELRLQQMTFAMVAVYALIWTGLTVAGRLNPDFPREFPMRGVGMLYFALLPLLVGSLASAQERHFGMLQSQAMLPVPRTRQWAVKASVVLVLALVLGVILPWFVFAPPQIPRTSFWPLAASILLLTTWSLYISSWCGSGIIALALLLPASAAAMALARWIDWAVTVLVSPQHSAGVYGVLAQPSAVFTTWVIAATPLAVLLLLFAARNHWTCERKPKTLAVQVAALASWLLLMDVVATVL